MVAHAYNLSIQETEDHGLKANMDYITTVHCRKLLSNIKNGPFCNFILWKLLVITKVLSWCSVVPNKWCEICFAYSLCYQDSANLSYLLSD